MVTKEDVGVSDNRGYFISLEGGEGVGKSHLLKGLAASLLNEGRQVVTTREPGGTPSADRIRMLFSQDDVHDPWLPLSEALLVSAARSQHVAKVIEPALAKGQWVITDRFADSTRVYQGMSPSANISKQDLEDLIRISTRGREPDLTLLLDCDVRVSWARIHTKTREQSILRYDDQLIEIHEQRRQAYLALAHDPKFNNRIVVLDASGSIDELFKSALATLRQRFGRDYV